MQRLNVITCVFNPYRFKSRYTLYNQFADYVKQFNINLITVEIAFGDRDHMVTNANNPNHVQLRTHTELWHKERALNIGVHRLTQLIPNWEYVAWMDCDIQFARTDWPEETVDLLQHYAVLQMFGRSQSLNPEHETGFIGNSIMKIYARDGTIKRAGDSPLYFPANPNNPNVNMGWKGHPGLAWAYRRSELESVGGWLDICIAGSADLHMTACYTGDYAIGLSSNSSKEYQQRIYMYGELCHNYIRQNVGYMPGLVTHYWHGKHVKRGYDLRWLLIDKYQFNPNTDLMLDFNGLYKWNDLYPHVLKLRYDTRRTLAERNEDSIDE